MTGSGENGHPVPRPLTPSDKDSFAYPTMKDRVPVIICKVVDLLYRDRVHLNLSEPDLLKDIIEEMSRLRYEMLTNKPLQKINDGRKDAEVWNQFLEKLRIENNGQPPTWYVIYSGPILK